MRQLPLPRPATRLASAIATLACVALLAAACGSSDPVDDALPGSDAGSGGTAEWPHDFQAELLGGGTIDAGDYEGQDLVLWFWAPW